MRGRAGPASQHVHAQRKAAEECPSGERPGLKWRAAGSNGRPFGTAAGVRKPVGEADERGDRGQVDDGAASAVGEHLLHAGLQAVEDALDVDLVEPAGGSAWSAVCAVLPV